MNTRFEWLKHFRFIYDYLGVDFEKMLMVMELKTRLLTRSWQGQAQGRRQSQKNTDPSLFNWGKSISYVFCSLFLMIYGFFFDDPGTALSLCFLVCFVMQFLGIITDFPVIILDTKDSTILATKPVDPKTVSAAKTTLTVVYMAINTMSLYALIFVPFIIKMEFGIVLMMAIAIPISNLICVALAYYLYGMVLKFFDGEKLKDVISGFQVLMTVMIMIAYQLIVRVTDLVSPKIALHFQWWHLLLPSYWLTYFTTLFNQSDSYPSLVLGLVSIFIIMTILVLHFKVTGQILEANLNKMLSDGEKKRGLYELKLSFQRWFSKLLFPRNHEARAFYLLGYSIAGNDRKMKQTIYPLYVSMLITPIIIFLNMASDYDNNIFAILREAPLVVLSLYFCAFATSTVIFFTKRTDHPKGCWIFDVLPVKSVNSAYIGAAYSLCAKYIWPPMAVISIIFYILGGTIILDDLILINAFVLFMVTLSMHFEKISWPFSKEIAESESKRYGLTIVLLLIPLIFAGVHALIALWSGTVGVLIASVVCILAAVLNLYLLHHKK